MIYITGDTHGDYDIKKLTTDRFPPKTVELTKDDYLIICGDWGGIWYGSAKDNYMIKWYNQKPWTTLFIDGNHENFDSLYTFPIVDFCGGKAHKISDSIYHLMRGQVFTIEGHTFFTMGGAESVDKHRRVEGISWWPQEMPSDEEYNEALDNIEKANNKVDFVLTHSAPDAWLDKWHYEHNKLTNFLEVLYETLDFKKWYFGHYHKDGYSDKFIYLYNSVVKLDDREM